MTDTKNKNIEFKRYLKSSKIIATIGPASDSLEVVRDLIASGVDLFRFNCSHGSHEDIKKRIKLIRDIEKEYGINIGLILDTKGPEIRTDTFKDGKVLYNAGSEIKINLTKTVIGDEKEFSINYSGLAKDIAKNSKILVDDGKLSLKIKSVNSDYIIVEAENTHLLTNNKSIIVTNTSLALDFFSQKDQDDVKFACENGIDFVAASFINAHLNVLTIRKFLDNHKGENVKIISKIETAQAINNFEAILKYSDAVMIARGDLGLAIPFYKLPDYQFKFINSALKQQKPVIVATHMLESMTTNLIPTRAEANDVYIAIMQGATATMLSAETASGKYPVVAASAMNKIIFHSESKFFKFKQAQFYKWFVRLENGSINNWLKILEKYHDVGSIFLKKYQTVDLRILGTFKSSVPIFVFKDENFNNLAYLSSSFVVVNPPKDLNKKSDSEIYKYLVSYCGGIYHQNSILNNVISKKMLIYDGEDFKTV